MAGQNVIVAVSISPQVLVSQQLSATEAALYTVPANTSVKIAQGSICNITGSATSPVLTLGTSSSTGGTFAAATYYWKVTAQSAGGQTLPSNEVSAALTGTTSSQPLSWTANPAAVSYNVWRGTAAGSENILVTTTTSTSYTDTGTSGSAGNIPTVSTFATPVTVYLSLVQTGGTLGDGTHRILNNYQLAANDTLTLKDYLGGHMLGPGDRIAAYASAASAVDLVVSGTVHA